MGANGMKRALVIQHVQFEGLGHFEPVLRARGYELNQVSAWQLRPNGEDLPGHDLVAILGGPIGAYQDQAYPFIAHELKLLNRALSSGTPVLGVCLGAQLLAQSMGGTVYPGPVKEIGIGTCRLTQQAADDWPGRALAEEFVVLHWHGDTFSLPPGATRLASNENYDNQAFCVGHQVLALQFHLEARAADVDAWLVGHAAELDKAGVDICRLRTSVVAADDALRVAATRLLEAWLDQQQT